MSNRRQLSADTKMANRLRSKGHPFKKDIIYSPEGQWKYPGQITRIPGGAITMHDVPYPVLGVDDQGNQQMMYPEQEYQFPGSYVTEYPILQQGGAKRPLFKSNKGAYADSVLTANKDKEWVNRILTKNSMSIPDPTDPNRTSTHLMSDNDQGYVFPSVVNLNGQLVYLPSIGINPEDYARETNTGIQLPKKEGTWFARNGYKTGKIGQEYFPEFAQGGSYQDLELDDDEIAKYKQLGYTVVELPKMQNAGEKKEYTKHKPILNTDPPGPLGKYITMYNKAVKTLGTDNPEVLKNFFASQQYGQNNTQIQQNNNINKAPQPKESKIGNVAGDIGTLALSTLQNFGMNIPGDIIKTVAPKAAILDVLPQTTTNQYVKQRNQSLGQNIKDVADAANTVAAFEVGTPLVMKGVQQGVKYLKPVVESGIDAVGKTINNTYKVNPWRFKPNPNAYYHRSPNLTNIINKEKNILQGFGESEAGKKFNNEVVKYKGLNLRKAANSQLYFSKGVPLDFGRYNKSGQGYKGPYMIEVENIPMGASVKGRKPSINPPTKIEGYAVSHRPINIDEAKFYKEHWLKGYKKIPKPNNTIGQFKLNDLSTGNNIKQDISFYHFSHNNNLSLKDIDVLRTGESQFKKRYLKAGIENLPSGFYTHKTKYPTFMKPGSPYEIKMPSDIKIHDLTKDGYNMSDRISKKEIMEYQKMGIDVLYGKNMIGQDEYIIINKDKIKSFTKIDKPKSIFELKNEFPGINFKGMSDYEIDNFIKNNQ